MRILAIRSSLPAKGSNGQHLKARVSLGAGDMVQMVVYLAKARP
jgi:hypothetical protein